MKRLEYQVTFNTPAFLGNAEQAGQWRTTPFKALLRQWWRVAYAAGCHTAVDVAAMRRDEGHLFGVASDQRAGSHKSQVRLRLDRWETGRMHSWQALGNVTHPEVRFPVDSGLYLAYGPVTLQRGGRMPTLKSNAAIQAKESAVFSLAVPWSEEQRLSDALGLMQRFGTLGGRSRNGWGSFSLVPIAESAPALEPTLQPSVLHAWKSALGLDWPHAIGADDQGPLIWQTRDSSEDWRAVMHQLAELKIGLRTQFRFPQERTPHHRPHDRHWISYPVTRHSVQGWGNEHLPNSLRYKVRPDAEGHLSGVIFHVPCAPPAKFRPDLQAIEQVWECVHRFLDDPSNGLTRIPA